MADRESVVWPSWADWMALVFMLLTMLMDSCSAASAVCTMLIPSLPFLMAWPSPRAWDFKESAMDMPDASSAALLIRSPDESLSRELDRELSVEIMFLWELSAATLVLILSAIGVNLHVIVFAGNPFPIFTIIVYCH